LARKKNNGAREREAYPQSSIQHEKHEPHIHTFNWL